MKGAGAGAEEKLGSGMGVWGIEPGCRYLPGLCWGWG